MRRWSPEDIEKLRLMASVGHGGKSIAAAIGVTPQACRVKSVELGIRLRPPSIEHRRVKLPLDIWKGLRAIAEEKNTTVQRIAGLLLSTIVKDKLYAAIIDEEPRAVRRSVHDQVVFARKQKPKPLAIAPLPLMPGPPLLGCIGLVAFAPSNSLKIGERSSEGMAR